jgi:hypothetical protein
MKTKIQNLERRQDVLENDQRDFESNYVTHKHLDSILPPISHTLDEVQKDIKTILMMLGSRK